MDSLRFQLPSSIFFFFSFFFFFFSFFFSFSSVSEDKAFKYDSLLLLGKKQQITTKILEHGKGRITNRWGGGNSQIVWMTGSRGDSTHFDKKRMILRRCIAKKIIIIRIIINQ